MTVQIRNEKAEDAKRIREVTEAAFREATHTCGREHLMIDVLRDAGALTFSFVAESENGIVGHVAVSPVQVAEPTGEWFGIGPISVLPVHQKKGIGSALMREVIAHLQARGARGCLLVGDPGYYCRFGFRSDPLLSVRGVPLEVTLSLRFSPCPDRGTATFHAAFDEPAGQAGSV